MAHYENETIGVAFDLPDRITVRMQLAFRGAVALAMNENSYIRYWHGALTVIENWTCARLPDPAELDMDASDDPALADIVAWTTNAVVGHMMNRETPPKN